MRYSSLIWLESNWKLLVATIPEISGWLNRMRAQPELAGCGDNMWTWWAATGPSQASHHRPQQLARRRVPQAYWNGTFPAVAGR